MSDESYHDFIVFFYSKTDNIVIQPLTDRATEWLELHAGVVDFIDLETPEDISYFLDKIKADNYRIQEYHSG